MTKCEITLITVSLSNLGLYSNFTNCPIYDFHYKRKTFFSGPGPNPGWHTAFSCHVSLVSFDLNKLIHFPLYLLTLTLLRSTSHLFCTLSFSLVCLMFSHDYIQVLHSWQECHRNNILFSVYYVKRHMMLICFRYQWCSFWSFG